MAEPKKILIVRFSSIGDIVLTTPVIRCVKEQLSGVVVHFLTKEIFKEVLSNNPYLDKIHTFKEDVSELYAQLSSEKYDLVIDLHKNLRSLRLKRKLKVRVFAFDKLNLKKSAAVNFKMLNKLPGKHIVDRYFEGIASLGVTNDGKGLDYFVGEKDDINTSNLFPGGPTNFGVLVIGGSYYTKRIPLNKLEEICAYSKLPLILIGGLEDKTVADHLVSIYPSVINGCGKYSIGQGASLIQQANWVITSDTGMMHIAAAYHKKIISLWGNTIPEFGMSPYLPHPENRILEVKGLECRPCSKLGYQKCPLGHFQCMNAIDVSVVQELN